MPCVHECQFTSQVPLTYGFWAFVMGDARWYAEQTAAAAAAKA